MSFFTPNRRPLPNMLEQVEPAGETALRIQNAAFCLTLALRSGQVRIHPGICLTSSVNSDARPTHTNGPTTHSYRGPRVSDIAVHSAVWLLRRRDSVHEWSTGRNLQQGGAAGRWCSRIKRHHGTCLGRFCPKGPPRNRKLT